MASGERARDFLGSGWAFPPRLDHRGRILLSHHEQDIDEAIKIILLTRKGERPLRPQFGSDLHTLLFAPNDAMTAGLASRYVREALAWWEPRIEVEEVDCYPNPENPSALQIEIRYRVLVSNSSRNLVFPFYIIPGDD